MSEPKSDDARLSRIEEILDRLEDQQNRSNEFVVEAKTRLGNGQKSFDDLHRRVSDVETQTRPSVSRIVTWLAGALMGFGSMIWSGAMLAADRPTFAQAKELSANTKSEQAHEATKQKLDEHEKLIRQEHSDGEKYSLVQ